MIGLSSQLLVKNYHTSIFDEPNTLMLQLLRRQSLLDVIFQSAQTCIQRRKDCEANCKLKVKNVLSEQIVSNLHSGYRDINDIEWYS